MDRKILLVDDEQGICNVLKISLMDEGYQVYTSNSGEEALEIFEKVAPPIVLTDIKMPGMDGIELLKTIKRRNKETEVIMLTGHGDMNLAIRSLKHDATDFVTKPINDDVLEIALKRANERIMMRRRLREYTENLEKLVEEKSRKLIESEKLAAVGETVAGISHAIKNIAGGLKGGGFVIEQGLELDNKDYLRQGWEMIKGNVEKIMNLSLDLLNYGKSTTIDSRLGDPNSPAREVAELMTDKARDLGITLKLDLSPDLPDTRFDHESIHRCLTNLVTNALDAFTPDSLMFDESPENREKEVVLRTKTSESWAVVYEVSDTGAGMHEKIKRKIFRSFFSTKGSRGTGIGLMLTKKIVDQHRGEITVSSEPGKGSSFIIRLPRTG